MPNCSAAFCRKPGSMAPPMDTLALTVAFRACKTLAVLGLRNAPEIAPAAKAPSYSARALGSLTRASAAGSFLYAPISAARDCVHCT